MFTAFSENIPSEVIEYLTRWSKYGHWYSHALAFSFLNAPVEEKPKIFDCLAGLIVGKDATVALEALGALQMLPDELISEDLARISHEE